MLSQRCTFIAVFSTLFFSGYSPAQTNYELEDKLARSADRLIRAAQGKTEMTFSQVLTLFEKIEGFSFKVNGGAYRDLKVMLVDKTMISFPQGRGLRMDTLLQFCLDQLPAETSYKIDSPNILIGPGKAPVLKPELEKNVEMIKKLSKPVQLPTGDKLTYAQVLRQVEEQCRVAFLINPRDFQKVDRAQQPFVVVDTAPLQKTSGAVLLRSLMTHTRTVAVVQEDHVRILPARD